MTKNVKGCGITRVISLAVIFLGAQQFQYCGQYCPCPGLVRAHQEQTGHSFPFTWQAPTQVLLHSGCSAVEYVKECYGE